MPGGTSSFNLTSVSPFLPKFVSDTSSPAWPSRFDTARSVSPNLSTSLILCSVLSFVFLMLLPYLKLISGCLDLFQAELAIFERSLSSYNITIPEIRAAYVMAYSLDKTACAKTVCNYIHIWNS